MQELVMVWRIDILLTCLWLFPVANVLPQDPSLFADARLYDATLERLLRHDVPLRTAELELRYTYCDAGEMQVVVQRLDDDGFKLEIWYLRPGSPTLWAQLAKVATPRPNVTPEEAARSMQLARATLVARLNSPLGTLLEGAESVSIPVVNHDLAVLEGMKYGFALKSPTEELSLTIMATQSAEKSEYELIRWMGKVRASVEELLRARRVAPGAARSGR